MKIILILILIFTTIASCNKIDNEKLKIIDNFKLGGSIKNYYQQMDSLGYKRTEFITRSDILTQLDPIGTNLINEYYTNIFDFDEYKINTNHYAIFVPVKYQETNNVTGIYLILFHTAKPTVYQCNQETFAYSLKNNTKFIEQDINSQIPNKIKDQISLKYGKPITKDSISNYSTKISFFENKTNNSEASQKITRWETEYYNVYYFESTETDNYFIFNEYGYKRNPEFKKIKENETDCSLYNYIFYQMKESVIKKMELDKPKL